MHCVLHEHEHHKYSVPSHGGQQLAWLITGQDTVVILIYFMQQDVQNIHTLSRNIEFYWYLSQPVPNTNKLYIFQDNVRIF
jgi:hypothetical protein